MNCSKRFAKRLFWIRTLRVGMLLVKVCERRATSLGLNPPLVHAVQGCAEGANRAEARAGASSTAAASVGRDRPFVIGWGLSSGDSARKRMISRCSPGRRRCAIRAWRGPGPRCPDAAQAINSNRRFAINFAPLVTTTTDFGSGARSLEACGSWRAVARDRVELQGRSLDDLPAQGALLCRGLNPPGLFWLV
jgi:hypothetical protein